MDPHRAPSDGSFGTEKTCIHDLALFGGVPLFRRHLHVGRPNLPDSDALLRRLRPVLERRWLTNDGPEVREFEHQVAEIAGVRHCVAMCNGTTALQIAMRAADLSGEVILPSFTFVATAHALEWQAIRPVFCDIDENYCLDPAQVEALITPRTTGIIGVHLWGQGCNVEELSAICRRHNLSLLFDAAHAFGCSHKGRMIGGFGQAEVFSFHATKFVNTLEGGAVVTNDDGFADRCRAMRNFGFSGEDAVAALGINGKMNEFEAVMGLESLGAMDTIIAANRANYFAYRQELEGIPGIRLRDYDLSERSNFQYVPIEIDEEAGLTRDQVHDLLHAENVLARRYFYPGCHRMEPYRTRYPEAARHLQVTERASGRILCLPTGPTLDAGAISTICGLLRFITGHDAEVRERWSGFRRKLSTPDEEVR